MSHPREVSVFGLDQQGWKDIDRNMESEFKCLTAPPGTREDSCMHAPACSQLRA